MIKRCYSEEYNKKFPAYKNVTCCKEWLYYPNFYEWLHTQKNFEKWFNNGDWALDKDIIKKGNKVYSPDNCCLIPQNINNLFTKNNAIRGDLPIGVRKNNKKYQARLRITINNKKEEVFNKTCDTPEEAFLAYKNAKEDYIKKVAQEEYSKGNITERCYNSMMNYEVEITD
jgi:hypothetical protein